MAEKSGEIKLSENEGISTNRADSLATNDLISDETKTAAAAASDQIATEPAEIRGQIAETRREMSETINEIQERLSFENISEQVAGKVSEQLSGAVESFKTTVSDATIGRAGKAVKSLSRQFKNSDFTRKFGSNPAPLAIVGVGLGLLLFNLMQKKKSAAKYRYRQNSAQKEAIQSDESQTLGEKAGKLYENVSQQAGSAYETASDKASKAYDKLGKIGGHLQNQYQQRLAGNPLAGGVIALAAGAAIGALVPLSDYENELMGEARNQLMAQAQEAANGTIEKVQQAVGQAKDTIVEEVESQVGQQ